MKKTSLYLCVALLLLCILAGSVSAADEFRPSSVNMSVFSSVNISVHSSMDMSVSSSVDISVPLYAPDHIFVKYDPNLIRSLSAESAAEILKDFSNLVPGRQIIELPDGVTL